MSLIAASTMKSGQSTNAESSTQIVTQNETSKGSTSLSNYPLASTEPITDKAGVGLEHVDGAADSGEGQWNAPSTAAGPGLQNNELLAQLELISLKAHFICRSIASLVGKGTIPLCLQQSQVRVSHLVSYMLTRYGGDFCLGAVTATSYWRWRYRLLAALTVHYVCIMYHM